MPFKPNYGQQRSERARLKQARREEKLKQRRERAVQHKDGGTGDADGSGPGRAEEAAMTVVRRSSE